MNNRIRPCGKPRLNDENSTCLCKFNLKREVYNSLTFQKGTEYEQDTSIDKSKRSLSCLPIGRHLSYVTNAIVALVHKGGPWYGNCEKRSIG